MNLAAESWHRYEASISVLKIVFLKAAFVDHIVFLQVYKNKDKRCMPVQCLVSCVSCLLYYVMCLASFSLQLIPPIQQLTGF